MINKEKILSYLKKIGIAIAGFIGTILFCKLFALLKNKDTRREEDVKEAIDEIKKDISETKEIIKDSGDTIEDIKTIMAEAKDDRDNIVTNSIDNRVKAAENAGFKRIMP
jgi:F0F1-type ATP synthase membrane subunit b/b'